jgi:hypothetical protein
VYLCLLEDDRLVTRLSLQTQQLLEPDAEDGSVILLVAVQTKKVSDMEPYIAHRGWR